MKNCIINFANGIHANAQKRLLASLKKVNYKGGLLFYSPKESLNDINFPKQETSPWGFKPYMFLEAQRKGFTKILWVDSSLICIRNPKKIFDILDTQGYFIFSKKISKVSQWSSDYALKEMNLSRTEAKKIPEIRAHILGLNLEFKIAQDFLDEWYKKSNDGISFRGLPIEFPLENTFHNINKQISSDTDVLGHRHDQTIASIIAHKLNMKIISKYSMDYEGEVKNSYAPIEYDCIFLHDRSYKKGEIYYVDWSENKKNALERMFYFIYSFIYTKFKRLYNKVFK